MSAEHQDYHPRYQLNTSDKVWLWLTRNYHHLEGFFRLTCASGAFLGVINAPPSSALENVPPPTSSPTCSSSDVPIWNIVSNWGGQASIHPLALECVRKGEIVPTLGKLVDALATLEYIAPELRASCAATIRDRFPSMFSNEIDPQKARFVEDPFKINVYIWIGPIDTLCPPRLVVLIKSTVTPMPPTTVDGAVATSEVSVPTSDQPSQGIVATPTETEASSDAVDNGFNLDGAIAGGCIAMFVIFLGSGGYLLYINWKNRADQQRVGLLQLPEPQDLPQSRWPWGNTSSEVVDSAPYLNEHNPQDPYSGVQGDGLTQVHLPEPLIIGGDYTHDEEGLPASPLDQSKPLSLLLHRRQETPPDDPHSLSPSLVLEHGVPLLSSIKSESAAAKSANYESTLTNAVRKRIEIIHSILKKYDILLELENGGVEIRRDERITIFKFRVIEGSSGEQFADLGTTTSQSKPEIENEIRDRLKPNLKGLTHIELIADLTAFADKKRIIIHLVGYIPQKLFK